MHHIFDLSKFEWTPETRTLSAFQSQLFSSRHSRIADEIIITGHNHQITFHKVKREGNVAIFEPDVTTPEEYQDLKVIYYGP